MLLKCLSVFNYIDQLYAKPRSTNLYSTDVNDREHRDWIASRKEDAKARLAISYNIKFDILELTTSKTISLSGWTTLQEYFEGKCLRY